MAEDKTNLQSELSKIQAIKEIIAGEDIKEIRGSIAALEQKIDQRLDELTNKLTVAIEKLDQKLNTKLEKTEEKAKVSEQKLKDDKVDRSKLGKLLEELGQKLQK